MNKIEDQLREEFANRVADSAVANHDRLNEVRRRRSREAWVRPTLVAASVVTVLAAVGLTVAVMQEGDSGRDLPVATGKAGADPQKRVKEMLTGAPVPPGFDSQPLTPLAERKRVNEVRGFSEAVVCAWVSSWETAQTADPRWAAEISTLLNTSDDWAMLQAIAEDNKYPARVALIAAEISLDRLRPTWRAYLHCDRFPGNTNLG